MNEPIVESLVVWVDQDLVIKDAVRNYELNQYLGSIDYINDSLNSIFNTIGQYMGRIIRIMTGGLFKSLHGLTESTILVSSSKAYKMALFMQKTARKILLTDLLIGVFGFDVENSIFKNKIVEKLKKLIIYEQCLLEDCKKRVILELDVVIKNRRENELCYEIDDDWYSYEYYEIKDLVKNWEEDLEDFQEEDVKLLHARKLKTDRSKNKAKRSRRKNI